MLPASNRTGGMKIGFPDVCNTPVGPATVPIPYPNIGSNAMAAPFSPNVYYTMGNALNIGSTVVLTSGDEGGVAHPTIKGPARNTVGTPIVYVNNLPGTHLGCPSGGNNMNNALGADLVPTVTNVFLTYRAGSRAGEGGARPLSREEVDAMEAALSTPVSPVLRLLEGGVGYVDVPPFSAAMPTRLARAIARLDREGMRALVLDLRDNPGGDAGAFVRLAEDFLPSGSALARKRDLDGDEALLRARHDDPYRFPLYLLVNRWTASAAELFAGCLQWHRRATLIGEATYGKGAARRVIATESGFFEVDAALFLLPDGEALEGVGLSPDEATAGERAPCVERDPAVQAAIALIAGRVGEERR